LDDEIGFSMQNLGIYYRVSTDRQDLASQISTVEGWLEDLPDDQKPASVRIFKDHGVSGKTTQRKGYQELLRAAYQKEIDTIVVYRLDRISRQATEAIQTLLSLDQAGVGFISVTQPVLNLGLDNPFRRTMLAAFSEIAEIERDTIVTRVRAGLDAARRRGVKLGRPRKVTDEHIQKLQVMRSEGYSFDAIAKELGLSRASVQNLAKQIQSKSP
jgi:DNA invertase Pin-like site-specific DNA recombinase